ncbi:hypothetical protein BKA56DRAFT_592603 [Ilyonectria sp. MPI-CAGE-AT-0026]|nr:hypothetical protein BKA56DRAFT_592603 [Ilyonectria sp. MPI-CAGE-AT-0026]
MGQTFQLVAPREGIALCWGGKLGEMLSDGSAKDFICLLAIPVRHQNPTIQPRHLHRHNLETTIVLLVAGDSVQEVRINRCAKRKADGEALASPP